MKRSSVLAPHRSRTPLTAMLLALALVSVACGSNADQDEVTLITYDSFPLEGTPVNDLLDEFSEETGLEVAIVSAGDTGTMLAKASLAAGNPEGDVMWGIDSTYLSRALDDDIFEPYAPQGTDLLDDDFLEQVPGDEVVPVDYGDVCINYDISELEERGIAAPASLDSLIMPEYRDMLVVQNPATSSVGLAFLLATIDEYGEDGWRDYWSDLAANGVRVVDGWTQAYNEEFSQQGGGRPLVVSYGTSPPLDVLFSDLPLDEAPTAVVANTCYRQIEFAGILRGTANRSGAEQLIDFLISTEFQSQLPLNLFVYPANSMATEPDEFIRFATRPDDPRQLDPARIEANRSTWIDEWTNVVLG